MEGLLVVLKWSRYLKVTWDILILPRRLRCHSYMQGRPISEIDRMITGKSALAENGSPNHLGNCNVTGKISVRPITEVLTTKCVKGC